MKDDEEETAECLREYFSGRRLYGDDFDAEWIAQWYADEAEGYAGLGAEDRTSYHYAYHALNHYHGYRHLKGLAFEKALGFGGAYGDELLPVIARIGSITLVDASECFSGVAHISGVRCEHVRAHVSGDLPFASATFDLLTCLGVLHHIPNVSHVVAEFARCLKPGAAMLLREPITSMGDWSRRRPGLTARERGIPVKIFDELVSNCGLVVRHRAFCVFPVVSILARSLGKQAYNHLGMTVLDAMLSWAFSWNRQYHRTNLWQKLGPQSLFYVIEKPA